MKQSLKRAIGGFAPVGLAALAVVLSGCGNFFVKPGSTSSTTTGTTGSYAYVSNVSTNSMAIGAYALASGSLAPVTGSPFVVSYVPAAMSVVPGNTFLYVANSASTTPGIYAYSIATSTGALTVANSGNQVAAIQVAAMDISPDGKYLIALNLDGSTLTEYSINSSTGVLTFASTVTYAGPAGTVVTPAAVKVAPSGSFIVASLGTAGDVIFPYSSGVINPTFINVTTGSTTVGDYSATLDSSNFLYLARTSSVAVYSLSTAGVPTAVNGSPFTAGTAPRSVVLQNGYVYDANQTSGTISAFAISGAGVLTNLAGSPYTSAATVTTLGVDNSGKYLLALGYDNGASGGLRMYAFGSGGALSSTGSSVATGTVTTVPAVMALTH